MVHCIVQVEIHILHLLSFYCSQVSNFAGNAFFYKNPAFVQLWFVTTCTCAGVKVSTRNYQRQAFTGLSTEGIGEKSKSFSIEDIREEHLLLPKLYL